MCIRVTAGGGFGARNSDWSTRHRLSGSLPQYYDLQLGKLTGYIFRIEKKPTCKVICVTNCKWFSSWSILKTVRAKWKCLQVDENSATHFPYIAAACVLIAAKMDDTAAPSLASLCVIHSTWDSLLFLQLILNSTDLTRSSGFLNICVTFLDSSNLHVRLWACNLQWQTVEIKFATDNHVMFLLLTNASRHPCCHKESKFPFRAWVCAKFLSEF